MSLIIQIGTMNVSIDNLVFDFDTFQYTFFIRKRFLEAEN